MWRWAVETPDLTLNQLQQKLLEERGLSISRAQVARALKRMRMRLKKRRTARL
jgi:transposase